MAEFEIVHRLYSHAPEESLTEWGWQHAPLDERNAADVLREEVVRELDETMGKMAPSEAAPAWVVRRFAAEDDTYACVIVSYSDLVEAAGGGPGLLTHARLVRVPSTQAWFDAAALVALAENFALDDVRNAPSADRLRRYLDLLSEEAVVTVREVSMSELVELPRTFVCEALAGTLHGISQRQEIRIALPPPERSLAAELAQVWALIPVALQRTSAWAVGVENGCPVDVIFAVSSGAKASGFGSENLVKFVAWYVNLLLDSPHDYSAVLRKPEMVSPTKIQEALQRVEPLMAIHEAPPAGKSAMSTRKGKKDEPQTPFTAPRGNLDPETIKEMDRQYRTMEATLRNYIDQRFAAMASGAGGQQQDEQPKPSMWSRVSAFFNRSAAEENTDVPRPSTWRRTVAIAALMLMTVGVTWAIFVIREMKEPPLAYGVPSARLKKEKKPVRDVEPAQITEKAILQKAVDDAASDTVNQPWSSGLFNLAKGHGSIVAKKIEGRLQTVPQDDPVRMKLEELLPAIKTGKLTSVLDLRPLMVQMITRLDPSDSTNTAVLQRNPCVKSGATDAVTVQGEIALRWLNGETCQ